MTFETDDNTTIPASGQEILSVPRGKVVPIERRRSRLAGGGMLKGLAVVWNHWVKSFGKLDDHSKIAGTFTTEYPEERLPLPEAYRNMPVLLYDDETGQELCTSCFQCQRICPPQVIHMTQEKDPATGKAVPAVAEFIIEYDACMSCGFCAEVCPFDAIKMDHTYELSTADHSSLTVHKQDLNRPVSYYESIAPNWWAAARDTAYKKLTGNMKRRPGAIGIAPHLVEKIKEAEEQQAAEAAKAAEAKRAAEAEKAAEAAPAGDAPTDKQAKLAAIRARNAAKKAAQDDSVQPDAQPPAAAEDEPLPTDKQAKLAAIRARNAAKKAAQEGGQPPAAQEPAEPAAAEDEPLPTDKQAKLAAIRARNAAKKAAEAAATAEQNAPQVEDEQPPAQSTEQSEPPAEAPPQDEKAARLAAIRARNAEKKRKQQEGNQED
jgi:NADH-quinone oxidoreductase subunit I/electron transport complex protein RnfC